MIILNVVSDITDKKVSLQELAALIQKTSFSFAEDMAEEMVKPDYLLDGLAEQLEALSDEDLKMIAKEIFAIKVNNFANL